MAISPLLASDSIVHLPGRGGKCSFRTISTSSCQAVCSAVPEESEENMCEQPLCEAVLQPSCISIVS